MRASCKHVAIDIVIVIIEILYELTRPPHHIFIICILVSMLTSFELN